MTFLITGMLDGTIGDIEAAALLVALRSKGESAVELAAAARVLRQRCISLNLGQDILDTCGTGGDGLETFNISTATAIVVAACGVRVVKHGNRAISSKSGSADVLTELGVAVSGDPQLARRCLDRARMAFCMAPLYHPQLKQIGEVRRRLKVRTLFNCLGPLANPANAPYQLLGVGRREWLEPMSEAMAQLQTQRAFLVHAEDGLDEVSLSAPTLVRHVQGSEVTSLRWTASDFGLPSCSLEDLRVDSPTQSAERIRQILAGHEGPSRWVVLANAAAALLVTQTVDSLPAGVARASEAIDSGRAAQTLAELCEQTRAS
jgi:anthranilate phosphoribosyltransferase